PEMVSACAALPPGPTICVRCGAPDFLGRCLLSLVPALRGELTEKSSRTPTAGRRTTAAGVDDEVACERTGSPVPPDRRGAARADSRARIRARRPVAEPAQARPDLRGHADDAPPGARAPGARAPDRPATRARNVRG